PQRVSRWFLPVSGDLRLGGDYQLEGHAAGQVLECYPPRRLAVTWVSGGTGSRVIVELSPREDGTELVLRHELADDDHWRTYGAGATGVGWELTLLGLAMHLAGAPPVGDPAEFLARPETQALLRASAGAWGDAEAASGTDAAVAQERAARTSEADAPTGG
ncbi:MAG: SRPBCC domain-containing protein, partial [Actinomycetota bacterium]|nr:SRPBCC domain-containing protein [Actinomycetota bacterium]